MFYLKWTPSELATLRAGALYTEVDEDGWVQRELGIGEDGLITHQLVPSDARPGWFGLARLSFAMLDSNVTKAESSPSGTPAPVVRRRGDRSSGSLAAGTRCS